MLNSATGSRVISRVLVLAIAALLAPPAIASAQEPAKKDVAKKVEAKKKTPKAKARGRLPAHFGRVVSSKQRATIYKLQAEFAEKMAALKAQLATLAEARDKEVEAVLTPDQRRQVAKLREDAKTARDARAKTKLDKAAESGDAKAG